MPSVLRGKALKFAHALTQRLWEIVSGVKRGIRIPTVLTVAKLANAHGVDLAKLLELQG